MSKLQQLFEQKKNIVAEMRDLGKAVENGTYTAEQDARFQKMDTDLKALDSQIEVLQRAKQLEALETVQNGEKVEVDIKKDKRVEASAEQRAQVFAKAKKSGYDNLSEEERGIYKTIEVDRKVFDKYMRHGIESLTAEEAQILNKRAVNSRGENIEQRVQLVGTPSAGGYTVPEGFSGYIVEHMAFISQVLNWAQILNTQTGNSIPFPTNDDTSSTGELITENGDISSSSGDLTFGVETLAAYKFSSKMIPVSAELLQDNGVNLEAYIGKKAAWRVGKIANSYFTTGTGSSQPEGYITGATQGKVSASATAFTADELIDLMHSVDAAYRSSPKCAWAMHDLILAAIKKLSNSSSDDRPLWLPSIRESEPDTLYGKPYFINNAMASTLATGNKVIAFGDWDNFLVRIVNNFSMKRLNERYAEYDRVAFFGLARMDSRVLNASAIKYLELT